MLEFFKLLLTIHCIYYVYMYKYTAIYIHISTRARIHNTHKNTHTLTDTVHTRYTHSIHVIHQNDLRAGSDIEPEKKIAKLCLIVLAALYACYALYGGCVLVKII